MLIPTASAANSWLRDENGRALILHGLNISNVAKTTTDHMSWHTYADYERMRKDWGFNVIRLLIFWSAIEPEPWVFNETYLDKIEERVEWARSLGLYVILDMHQDLYGEKYPGGNGAPVWATWDDNLSFKWLNPWWLNYLQPPVRRAFTNFWTSKELQKHFFASWKFVAKRFVNNTAIIGYDLFNEPYFGELNPWIFESKYLRCFYLNLITEIRKVDPNHLCFYEPQILTGSGFKSFLGILPKENLAYFPHFYHPLVHEGFPYRHSFLLQCALTRRDNEAENAGVPWMLGEFGVAPDTPGMDRYLMDILTLLNEKMAGWTYYSYDHSSSEIFGIIDEEGNEQRQLNYLVYPYPQKIAGDPIRISYSYDTRTLTVEFSGNTHASGPTEIYVGSSRIYPEGFVITCSDPEDTWSWEYSAEFDVVKVWNNHALESHRITIAPRG
jgi:endoglycosylceramidase